MERPKVMIFGTFDLLHPGHEFLIRSALRRGSLTVVVGRDATVTAIKGRKARQSEGERVAALKKRFPEATIVLGDDEDFSAPLRKFKPDLLILGYDQRLPPGMTEADLPCAVERAPALRPETYKTSRMRGRKRVVTRLPQRG